MDKSAYLLIFFSIMSIIGIIMTVYDKCAAQKSKRRIPEKALMIESFFGGAIGMYTAMHLIRHKTKHKKFMVGLPLIIILHIAIIIVTIFFK